MVKPNILITGKFETFQRSSIQYVYKYKSTTGTPGVGKTRLCKELIKKHKYTYLDVSDIAKRNEYLLDYCEKLDCPELDEDKVKKT